jgi:hypothetical protein
VAVVNGPEQPAFPQRFSVILDIRKYRQQKKTPDVDFDAQAADDL